MSNRSKNSSNFENQVINFPLSLNDSLEDCSQMDFSSVIYWINSFEFTRQKKTIARDFSDASKKNKTYIKL